MTEHPSQVTFENGAVVVDARVIGDALGLDASALRDLIRAGQVATVCESGIDADAGTWRLTFRLSNRRLRLVVDADGRILKRSMVNFGDRPPTRPIRQAP